MTVLLIYPEIEAMYIQIASLCIVMLYKGDPDIDADTCTIPCIATSHRDGLTFPTVS